MEQKRLRTIKRIGTISQLVCLITSVGIVLSLTFVSLFVVASDSMEPTLGKGDIVLMLTTVQPENLTEGEIAGYKSGTGMTVIHRTVTPYLDTESDRVAWRMQGDANEGMDVEILTSDNCVGKYLCHIPAAKIPTFKMAVGLFCGAALVVVVVGGMLRVYGDTKLSDKAAKVSDKK